MNVAGTTCSECGGELSPGSTGVICRACLLGAALRETPTCTESSSRELAVLLARPTPALGVKFHYFGDYELIEEIARGGMGVVFRAHQISLNRNVALKMIVAGPLATPEAAERFRTEAQAAARLDHPGIVPIYEVGEHDGLHYFTMKLVEGGNLADCLRDGPLPARRAAELLAAVARAVDHAHQRHVLHRDLKPGNILIDAAGQPHVTDFGLAKLVSQRDSAPTATVLGTPSYVAPEQALGGQPMAAADIFSLGVILYEMLSGQLPFKGGTPLETVRRAAEELPASLRRTGIDAGLEAICFKCLHHNPAERYDTAAALADDLENWLQGLPIQASRTTPLSRARRWMRHHPAAAVALMLFVIIVTAGPVLVRELRTARAEKDEFVSSVREEKIRDLKALRKQWAQLDIPFVSISSELRAEIWKARSSALFPESEPERYVVGIYAHKKPVETAGQFAPFLAWMENNLSAARSNRVRLDLRIYKDNRAARQALVHRAVDVVRLGAGPFLVAAEESGLAGERVQVLAKARPGTYTAVLCARSDSGITNVAALKGRSLALGDPESTISGFHMPALLTDHGLTAKDLHVEFHDSHGDAMKAVLNGKFEAGVAKTSLFESRRERSPGLIALTNVTCISMPWVARSNLRPEVAAIFRDSLLALRDPRVLELLPDSPDGFEPASVEDYEPMRSQCEGADRFLRTADVRLLSSGSEGESKEAR